MFIRICAFVMVSPKEKKRKKLTALVLEHNTLLLYQVRFLHNIFLKDL